MLQEFAPRQDFLAPIGIFAERLLGKDIEHTREHAAGIQALLVVFDKHLLPDDAIFENPVDIEGQKKKYKDDFFFRNMDRDYVDLKNDLMDMVPDPANVDAQINEAKELVALGQGVPNVPPLGMILAKHLSKDVVNSCLQVQAGLRVIGIAEKWPGHEKIVPARVFDNDPAALKSIQTTLNDVLQNGAKYDEAALQVTRAAGISAITAAQGQLAEAGHITAVHTLDKYLSSQHHITDQFTSNKSLQDGQRVPSNNIGDSLRPNAP